MTTVSDAESLIRSHMPSWPDEPVPLAHAAGRVLAQPLDAERDIPAYDRVTMDGIAIAHARFAAGARQFSIAGVAAAGTPQQSLVDSASCLRVMTGAILPQGTDTVIPVERVTLTAGLADIAAEARVEPGQFVHRQGSDRRRGAALLAPGVRLGAPELAILASAGAAEVSVSRLPRIAVVATGDELVDVGDPLLPHQIRSSNDYAIAAALGRHQLGSVTRRQLRDDPDLLLASIAAAHAETEVLILSGGVSMGDFDFVPAVLKTLGVEVVFHRIEQKPGRPMWFGMSAAGKPVFALPGNPVSTLVCLTRFVVPALREAAGETAMTPELVRLQRDAQGGPAGWTWFVPVHLVASQPVGPALAEPVMINTSGDFPSLGGTPGIVELGPDPDSRRAGAAARLFRW